MTLLVTFQTALLNYLHIAGRDNYSDISEQVEVDVELVMLLLFYKRTSSLLALTNANAVFLGLGQRGAHGHGL